MKYEMINLQEHSSAIILEISRRSDEVTACFGVPNENKVIRNLWKYYELISEHTEQVLSVEELRTIQTRLGIYVPWKVSLPRTLLTALLISACVLGFIIWRVYSN